MNTFQPSTNATGSVKFMYHSREFLLTTMASQIICNPNLISTAFSANNIENIKASNNWPFMRGIHRWPLDSSHKRPVTRKAFPYCNFIMHNELSSAVTVVLNGVSPKYISVISGYMWAGAIYLNKGFKDKTTISTPLYKYNANCPLHQGGSLIQMGCNILFNDLFGQNQEWQVTLWVYQLHLICPLYSESYFSHIINSEHTRFIRCSWRPPCRIIW